MPDTVPSRKLRFTLPVRFESEASCKSILQSLGGRVLSVSVTKAPDHVTGTCRFETVDEASELGAALDGLLIGTFSVSVVPTEETEEERPVPSKRGRPPRDPASKQVAKPSAPKPQKEPKRAKLADSESSKKHTTPPVVKQPKVPAVVEKRKPGRPPKKKKQESENELSASSASSSSGSEGEEEVVKKPRSKNPSVSSRPARSSTPSDVPILRVSADADAATSDLAASAPSPEEMPRSPGPGPSSSAPPEELWEEFLDPTHSVPYFFCPATQTTTWERPTGQGVRIIKPRVVSEAEKAAEEREEREREEALLRAQRVPPSDYRPPRAAPSPHQPPGAGPRMHRGQSISHVSSEVFLGVISNVKHGYGFIRSQAHNGNKTDLFFHYDERLDAAWGPRPGEDVEFEMGFNEKRKQNVAILVRRKPVVGGRRSPPPAAARGGRFLRQARSRSPPRGSSYPPPRGVVAPEAGGGAGLGEV